MSSELKKFNKTLKGTSNVPLEYRDSLSSYGDFSVAKGINAKVVRLRNFLLIPLGSYPFDPTVGSLLYKKLFDPMDDISQQEIEYEVNQRLSSIDPGIGVSQVIITPMSDNKGYTLSITIEREGDTEEFDVSIISDQYFALE